MPPAAAPVPVACPFNGIGYVAGLANIGVPDQQAGSPVVLLRRPIVGTGLSDGMGPWPYAWIGNDDDITALRACFSHLVSVTTVTQPGYEPPAALVDAVPLKQHYVYDPSLPTPEHSRRARLRLRRCEEQARFEIVSDRPGRLEMVPLYERLKLRRRFGGSFMDFAAAHFESIAALDTARFFRVVDDVGTGAMACGVLFGDMLQILHITTTEHGLGWNASYLLMHGLQGFARDSGVRLFTGGMPDSGSAGLRVFKERWANDLAPVYLLRIVNDPARYAELGAGRQPTTFFPAYRAPLP